ncbi:hypothetical protein CHU98_g3790 [Xylaria longipes]|nr:hypothetical protein CHU98_g3790 [Xylaria longipes]
MASFHPRLQALIILVVACTHSANAADRSHYDHWYPQYADHFTGVARNSCSVAIQRYQEGDPPDLVDGCENVLTQVQCASAGVIACLLEHTTEEIKANMAAAAVVLGLLPTTLSLASSSTAEIGLLALRRPILALLLATGAPAVSPIRAFEYREPIHMLREGAGGLTAMFKLHEPWSMVVVFLQYALALGATANLVQVSWELGTHTVISFSSDNSYLPLLWYLLTLIIHIFGTMAVYVRVSLRSDSGFLYQKMNWTGWALVQSMWAKACQEFKLSGHQPVAVLRLRKEMPVFFLFSWITSTGTIVHIIYGTMLFSGTLFVGAQDAVLVVLRYFLSTVLCRIILMMEISGMGQSTKVFEQL